MNYFKGYSKKRKGRRIGFVEEYAKGAIGLSLGSQVLSQPAFGSIGQQGAQGLALGAQFLPPIAVIGMGGVVVKKLKKLKKT